MNGGRFRHEARGAADRESDDEGRDDEREALKRHGVREARHHDAGQLDQRADREIDAGGDDDEGLTDRKDRVVSDLAQNVREVAGRQERAVREHVDDRNDDRKRYDRPARSQQTRARGLRVLSLGGSLQLRGDGRFGHYAATPVATAITASGVASPRANSARIRPSRTTRTRCDIPSTSGNSLETITMPAPRRSKSTIST